MARRFQKIEVKEPTTHETVKILEGVIGRYEEHHRLDYAPDAGLSEVPDPYYGGASGFEQVLDLVDAAARGLVEELERSHPRRASAAES